MLPRQLPEPRFASLPLGFCLLFVHSFLLVFIFIFIFILVIFIVVVVSFALAASVVLVVGFFDLNAEQLAIRAQYQHNCMTANAELNLVDDVSVSRSISATLTPLERSLDWGRHRSDDFLLRPPVPSD